MSLPSIYYLNTSTHVTYKRLAFVKFFIVLFNNCQVHFTRNNNANPVPKHHKIKAYRGRGGKESSMYAVENKEFQSLDDSLIPHDPLNG